MGIGEGIVILYVKMVSVINLVIVFGCLKDGVDYELLDGQLVYLVFMIVVIEGVNNIYFEVLLRFLMLLMCEEICKQFFEVEFEDVIIDIINQYDKDDDEEEEEEEVVLVFVGKGKILVVIVCLIGIVYIFMVVDVFKEKVKELGVDIKVEINGLSGIKYKLIV